MEDKFYTAKYDRVFKTIFCNEDDTHLMKILLSKILDKNIKRIEFLRNELEVKNVLDKTKIVDILALVDDEYIHIEINIVNDNRYAHIRNYIYFSEIFSKKTRRGDRYDYKTQFIHVDLSYGIKNKELVTKYYVMSERGEKYVDNINIIEFDMDKLKDVRYNQDERFKYLKILDLNLEEIESLSEGDEFIMEYKEKIKEINEDMTFRSAMTYEEDQRLMLNTERQIGYEKGIEKGIEKGKEEGLELGKENAKREIIVNLYNSNFTIEDISKYTEIDKNEVIKIINKK